MTGLILPYLALFLVFLPTSMGLADQALLQVQPVPPAIPLNQPSLPLDAHVKTGLEVEEAAQGRWTELRRQTQDFVKFRRNQMERAEKLAWIQSCFSQGESNLFCRFMIDPKPRQDLKLDLMVSNSAEAMPESSPVQEVERVAKALRANEPAKIKEDSEARILRALRGVKQWSEVEAISEAVLSGMLCPNPNLLSALGLKAEEYFPDPKFRTYAKKAYERALKCSPTQESGEKVAYRLGLLWIWEGECKKADDLLEPMSEMKKSDYFTRSLYWRAYCAQTRGLNDLAVKLRAQLYQDSPLSYHGLLLSDTRSARAKELLASEPVRIQYRSARNPDLNPAVRAIEILLEMAGPVDAKGDSAKSKARDLAREILDSLVERLANSETPFRLYLATLTLQMKDPIGTFKTLSTIFRDDPKAISRSTLEVFYPLKRFADLQQQGSKIDPYLVAALIRQESGFNEWAHSKVGALGLMQLMPQTARRMERVSKRDLFNGRTNIRVGVKYFSSLVNRYQYDAELALAAYNAGPEKVDSWIKRYPMENRTLFFDLIPFRETRDYVALIARNYYWYLSLYAQGIDLDEVRVRDLASKKAKNMPLTFTLFSDPAANGAAQPSLMKTPLPEQIESR